MYCAITIIYKLLLFETLDTQHIFIDIGYNSMIFVVRVLAVLLLRIPAYCYR